MLKVKLLEHTRKMEMKPMVLLNSPDTQHQNQIHNQNHNQRKVMVLKKLSRLPMILLIKLQKQQEKLRKHYKERMDLLSDLESVEDFWPHVLSSTACAAKRNQT